MTASMVAKNQARRMFSRSLLREASGSGTTCATTFSANCYENRKPVSGSLESYAVPNASRRRTSLLLTLVLARRSR